MRALLFALLITPALAQDVHVKVDPNGGGSIASTTDYTTIQQALDHAPEAPHGRIYISIAPGTYRERIHVTRNRPRITLLGLGKDPGDVVITAAQNAKVAGGTYFTETAEINGDEFEADNVTFENTAGNSGQAVAIAVRSDRAIFKHCYFLGDQDTLFADFGRQYYLDSFIAGGVDFIFGNATAVFDHSEIRAIRRGYLTAQSRTSTEQTTGFVIDHSVITWSMPPDPSMPSGPLNPPRQLRPTPPFDTHAPILAGTGAVPLNYFFLGRPWRPFSRVVVMNTELPVTLNPEGWSVWSKNDVTPPQAFYAEFNNHGSGAATTSRVPWSHQLTAKEASAFSAANFLRGTDHWDPIAEAAKLP